MQCLNKAAFRHIAGGMTVEKYDETAQELIGRIDKMYRNNLERVSRLKGPMSEGYKALISSEPTNTEL